MGYYPTLLANLKIVVVMDEFRPHHHFRMVLFVWRGHSCPRPLILVFDFGFGFAFAFVALADCLRGQTCPRFCF